MTNILLEDVKSMEYSREKLFIAYSLGLTLFCSWIISLTFGIVLDMIFKKEPKDIK